MDPNKRFVTSLTRQDIREIADAANAYAGDGIDVIRTPDGLEISIDKMQFTRWVKTIIEGGKLQ